MSSVGSLEGDNMAIPKHPLVKILDRLEKEQLEKFQWYLKQAHFTNDNPVPPIELGNAKENTMKTVDVMVNRYAKQTLDIMVTILEHIPRMDILDTLSKELSKSEGGRYWLKHSRLGGGMRPGCGSSVVSEKVCGPGLKRRHQDNEQHPRDKIRRPSSGSGPDPEPHPDPRSKGGRSKCHHVDKDGPQALDRRIHHQGPASAMSTLVSVDIDEAIEVKAGPRCDDQKIHETRPDPEESSHPINMGEVSPPPLGPGNPAAECQQMLKLNLSRKFQCVFEGIAKAGNPTLLNQIYTEVYITEAGATGVDQDHEVTQIETASRKPHGPLTTIRCHDIFKRPPDRDQPIRTVMTKGVASIGKTVLTQKFSLDWAEDKANQDIRFIFPFTFRQLNVLKQKLSLVELVHHFFPETKDAGIWMFEDFRVVFILDGLDECRLPLDFHNTQILNDVSESASVDVLLVNLIRGNLLPSAHLWITTRPAAANQIPAQCVDMVTEVRGFTDPQKEEYFRKRFRDEDQASTIISHIKRSRSLHIMCHVPLFCWITATVLEHMLKTTERRQLPKTLTEMYIHFLVVLTKLKNIKYEGRSETDPHWSPETRKMIGSLGKLAFEQLKKGNLVFYESDLAESGIDVISASVYSGVFTQVFKEERGLYQDQVFCFIHLSVQEFMAAFHVHQTFINTGVNLLSEEQATSQSSGSADFYQTAVDLALQSPNGHLDLFLRFLIGLSLLTNHSLLRGLMTQTGNSSETNQKTAEYIKKKITEDVSSEKSINLFHCLNELGDQSLEEDVKQYLKAGCLSTDDLSPAQWSALVFIKLSEVDLDVFDLKQYYVSEKALVKLLPAVKHHRKALLSGCNLSERSCEALSSVLRSSSSKLRELDMSNNDLRDLGVKMLCSGLESPQCRLEYLSLSGCLITEQGCGSLALALMANPSYLRELDLSYNHPGEDGKKHLSVALKNPYWKLETLRLDHDGPQWLEPGLKKYFHKLSLDENTANGKLRVCEDNRTVRCVMENQPYPEHQDRFSRCPQLLCSTDVSGRCYWEVEWQGQVFTAVTYRGIGRKGRGDDCELGGNHQSWSLICDQQYSVRHNNVETDLPQPSAFPSGRVAVYVDCPAGSLSFYRVLPDKLIHLHTSNTTFTQPLYAGFRLSPGSSVSLRR